MPFKSILAAYSGDATGSSGLKLALAIARRFDAHLTGVVWHGPSDFERRYRSYLTRDIIEMLAARDAETVAEIRADFEARVASESFAPRASFLDLKGVSDFSLAETARTYDLTVIGSRAAEVGREHFSARPDVVALRSVRPVILVPRDYAPGPTPLGRRVLVAWDGKRAAARALGDAMHFLDAGAEITVLTVGEEPRRHPGDDVMALLGRHGIAARRLVRPSSRGGTSATILSTAAEVGADLLVMGAYEHSKFSEDLLGGVTQDILTGAALPVLMSH
jgi:nucleotide-binding universal stress UspA family protein